MSTKEFLMAEASRCIQCKTQPCVAACPAHNPIPQALAKLKIGDFEGAYMLWEESTTMPEICGILCPHEMLCEGHCTLDKLHKPIRIGHVEEQLAMLFSGEVRLPSSKRNHRHLVIGLGPAGISNAIRMAEYGFQVDTIEKEPSLGGAILTHVPNFRFDEARLENFKSRFQTLKINTTFSCEVGKDLLLDDLIEEYDTVYIATGLDLPSEISLTKDSSLPVYHAIELLKKRDNHAKEQIALLGKTVGIIGLGNVALDIARTLIREGKEVHVLYRRTIPESPASIKEINMAISEGVHVHELLTPKEFRIVDGTRFLYLEKTQLIHDLSQNKTKVEIIPGSSVAFPLDDVILATGQRSSYEVFNSSRVVISKGKEDFLTNVTNVFVGGDLVNSEKRIVDAVVSGQTVARKIRDTYL